ncbi:MAG: hypothetical protein JNL67_02170 [Planctomycetaceae bacterium]|nr:hypothetical protein [Planctomycetaceae bacterium]
MGVSENDLFGGMIISAAFLSLLLLAEGWRYFWRPPTEYTRKLVHAGGGLIALGLPLFVTSHWVALILSVSMGLLLVVSKRMGWLASVHAIERQSRGAEYYPVVIYLLFVLAASEPWKYVAAVLNLAVADASAAMIGKRFGRIKYRVAGQHKSLEGSFAFYVASFLMTIGPLFWWSPLRDTPDEWLHYLLAANLIALLVTCFEAVSQDGQDNLWIPMGALLVLTKTFQTDVTDLWVQNASFVGILVVASVVARFSRTFELAGVLIFCLSSYGCWAMGSFDWALPIFVGFFVYVGVCSWLQTTWSLQIRAVTWSVIVPFIILAIGNIAIQYQNWETYRFLYGPFLAAATLALVQAVVNVCVFSIPGSSLLFRVAQAGCGSILVSGLLLGVLWGRGVVPDWWSATTMLGVVVIMAAFSAWLNTAANPETVGHLWFARRALLNLTAAGWIAVAQWQSLSATWVVA